MVFRTIKTVILFTYFLLLVYGPTKCTAKPPLKANVNKCCRIGEYLERADDPASSVCKIGGSDKWWPQIYLIAKKTIYNKSGSAPNHMSTIENTRPNCTNPESFTRNFYILSNGSLFLDERQINVPPSEYCAETNSVLVCFPESDNLTLAKRSFVRKCCGPRHIYDASNGRCMNVSLDHELSQKPIVNSPLVDIRVGFPECEKSRYAIAGLFSAPEFDDQTGVLTFDARKYLQPSHYCLEYTEDGAVQVFLCEDNFVAIPVEPDVSFF